MSISKIYPTFDILGFMLNLVSLENMVRNFLILLVVGFLLYLPSLFGPFLWDDEDFVYANQYVKEFRIDKFFTDSQTAGRGKLSNYYRPIPQIAYATTHAIFGFNPFWFHLLNVAVHIGAACAIFYFFKLLLGEQGARFQFSRAQPDPAEGGSRARENESSSRIALLISLVFLIHPVQTEAVSYISGLSDPLFVLFGFLSLIFFLKNKIWWSLSFFALCLLSKETGLVFLPLIVLLNPKRSIPSLLTAICYLWYHFTFINSFDIKAAWGNNPYANSIIVRLLTFIQNLFLYVQLLIFPKDLFMERDFTIPIQTNFLNVYFLVFILFNSIFFFLIRKSKILLFCFFAFYISFIPYMGIVLINGIFYEHFLYLPLVFFFAFWIILATHARTLLAKAVPKTQFGNRPALLVLLVLLVLLSLRTLSREFDWNDSIRFYSQTLKHAPKSIRIINGLGMAYAEKGDFDSALRQYSFGIRVNPKVPNLYHNLANIYAAEGKIDLAEKNYLKALEVDPNFFYSKQALDLLKRYR